MHFYSQEKGTYFTIEIGVVVRWWGDLEKRKYLEGMHTIKSVSQIGLPASWLPEPV